MTAPKKIPQAQLSRYFDEFSRRFLQDDSAESIDIEVIAPDLGDQPVIAGGRLYGITWDPHDGALEIAFDGGDHRAYDPVEVWVMEEPNGFVSALEIVTSSGTREILKIRQAGVNRMQ
jgi:hypothetical protein